MAESMGIKSALDQMDIQLIQIGKEFSENALLLLNLKNQRSKLQSIFEVRAQETERNFKLDVSKFSEEIIRSFKTHQNLGKMLDKKLIELKLGQEELAEDLLKIEQKVQQMQSALG